MTLHKLLLAGAASTLTAAPVLAGSLDAVADPVVAAPVTVVEPVGNWTGGYAGLQLGMVDADFGANSENGPGGGVSFGYDYDFGSWVVGAGVDYDRTDIALGGDTLESIARLKLRAGYDLGDGLLYATGGAARMETANLGSDTGYFAGVGYEHMLSEKVSIGGEILYNKVDDFAGSGSDLEATTASAKINFRF